MVIGCLFSGTIVDNFGRKAGHIFLSFFFLFSWLVLAFATDNIFLLIGRALSGIGVGAIRPIALVYLGEVTDPKYRGLALMCPSMSLCLGIIINHAIGGYVHWRTSCLISCVPCALCAVMTLFLKESPLWLIARGKIDQGAELFKWFRGDGEAAMKELNEMLERQKEKEDKSLLRELFQMHYLKPIIIVTLLAAATQFCGVNVLTFYAQDILEKTFPGKIDAFAIMLVSDFMRLLTNSIICFLGKVLPRRLTFIFFNFGTSATLFILVGYLYINPDNLMWLSVLLIMVYTSFGSGVVCLGWSFVPELFPAALRGLCSGFISAISFFLLFINVKITPSIMATYGEMSMYAAFGILTLLNTFVLCFILPETNGRSLQDIEDSYKKNTGNVMVSKL
ncbi:facilitated trehalose transporter Tret1-like isoform X2 [Epargyreus clarus]